MRTHRYGGKRLPHAFATAPVTFSTSQTVQAAAGRRAYQNQMPGRFGTTADEVGGVDSGGGECLQSAPNLVDGAGLT